MLACSVDWDRLCPAPDLASPAGLWVVGAPCIGRGAQDGGHHVQQSAKHNDSQLVIVERRGRNVPADSHLADPQTPTVKARRATR